MNRFDFTDFKGLECCPSSPQKLQWGISSLVYSSINTKAKVESCNPETGEYRIVLQGTLDTNPYYTQKF